MNKKIVSLLFFIILIAFFFRFYNTNWDQNTHLHPDERAIVMYSMPLKIPSTLSEFLSPQSSWNPHFFAYGSFPLYLLKISSETFSYIFPTITTYDGITILGRTISGLFDIGTLTMLFFLAKHLFGKKIGLISSSIYAVSTLPIQLSHFYAVDTLLTFFILCTLYLLILFYEKPSFKKALLVGIFFGFSLATKISATVLLASILIALVVDFLYIIAKAPHKPHHWLTHIPKFIKHLMFYAFLIGITTLFTYFILMPYSFIDFSEFQRQTIEQSKMTRDAFTFPYTLQYVGKIPYLYELKNIFLFGFGPLLTFFAFIGIILFTFKAIKNSKKNVQIGIIAIFFWSYFLMVGSFAIGFMRYMLPLYPLLCLFAAISLYDFFIFLRKRFGELPSLISYYLLLIAILLWPLSYLSIYSKLTTRITATEWILQNIPKGKTIAIEHWDDPLPLYRADSYSIDYLELYNYDSFEKWEKVNNQLKNADFIIIASNRLYVPLQKLKDCKLYPGHCYPFTARYYKELFSGKRGFKKIAEFSSYPTIPILNIPILDDAADESFTVYDHPKIYIFQKE